MSVETVALAATPALGPLYARAARQAASDAVTRRRRPTALPRRRVVVERAVVDPEAAVRWREVVGAADPHALPSVLVHTQVFGAALHLMAAPDFPLPLPGLVHLTNAVEHRAPLAVDTPYAVAAEALGLVPHHAGTAVDVAVAVRPADEADGAPLWRGVSRYLAKGVFLLEERPERPARVDADPGLPTAHWRLGAEAGRRYAGVSGDWNPIHLSGPTARVFGMKGAIAHGMLLAARMLDGREPAGAGHAWDIAFEAPVVLPARVAVRYERGAAAAPVEATGPRAGRTVVTGWDPKRGRRHFTGSLTTP